MLLDEAPQHSVKNSKEAGRQGGIPENQFNHTAGATAQLLAETKFCDRVEMNTKCHLNTGQRQRWANHGTHNLRIC
jgi:hypothetical protein